MKNFARIDNGTVAEVISIPDDANIADCFTPELVATLVPVDGMEPKPDQGWLFDGNSFSEPLPIQIPPAEILARNTAMRDALLTSAALALAPLQDAVDLGEATTGDSTTLTSWKRYRIAVNLVDLTLSSPVWPSSP